MTHRPGAVVLAVLIVGGCGSPRRDAPATSGSGAQHTRYAPACYALFDGGGRPASDSLFGAPPVVRLDTVSEASSGNESVAYRAISLDTAGREMRVRPPQVFGGGSWTVRAPDTVSLRYHDGFSGTVFTLIPEDQSGSRFTGYAIESFDAGPRSIRHEGVRAVRIPCSIASPQ